MATPDLILLHLPWGLIGNSRTRLDLSSPEVKPETSRSIAPLVFTRNAGPPVLNDDERLAEPFVEFRTRDGKPQLLWDLPVPLHAYEPQSLRFHSWVRPAQFVWEHAIDRPPLRTEDDAGSQPDAPEEPGAPLHRFLRTMQARMQDFETTLAAGQEPWSVVPQLWLDPDAPRDPTMDILVRHAREHRARWGDIAEHPRRLLNRRRELVPLSRVEELDVQCMQWLSRQPGKTLAERAGGRQRIMALARYENRNTLENRIFVDLMVRSMAAARDYLAMNEHRGGRGRSYRTARIQHVERYRQECRHIEVEMAEQGIIRQSDAVQPNYVLLYDERYRHVWTAREEIIRRERAMDELWRWQRRFWAEFCTAAVAVSLIWVGGTELAFASPLFVRPEHRRGSWLVHDDPMIVVDHREDGWVVELLSGRSDDLPKILRELGASAWLRHADLSGGDYRYLAIWTVHPVGFQTSLRGLVESADEALQRFRDHVRLPGGLVLTGGIVLLSLVDPASRAGTEKAENVSGCAFGPHGAQLAEGLEHLGNEIRGWLESAV